MKIHPDFLIFLKKQANIDNCFRTFLLDFDFFLLEQQDKDAHGWQMTQVENQEGKVTYYWFVPNEDFTEDQEFCVSPCWAVFTFTEEMIRTTTWTVIDRLKGVRWESIDLPFDIFNNVDFGFSSKKEAQLLKKGGSASWTVINLRSPEMVCELIYFGEYNTLTVRTPRIPLTLPFGKIPLSNIEIDQDAECWHQDYGIDQGVVTQEEIDKILGDQSNSLAPI